FRRCIILTGIDLSSLNGDLADRLLPVKLAELTTKERTTEAELWADWPIQQPRILGALLDLAVQVLARLPTLRVGELPRMADFARILAAVDQTMGTEGFRRFL